MRGGGGAGEEVLPNMSGVTVEVEGADADRGDAPVGGGAERGGAERGGAVAPGNASGTGAAAAVGGASREQAPAAGGSSGAETAAPGDVSGAGAAETEATAAAAAAEPATAADGSTRPLAVQPSSLFDRIYIVTDPACATRHEWVNSVAAAAGVTSPIEMFPLFNASAVDLRNPPLTVADVDAAATPAVTAADVALTATHRALWRRVFDDNHARVLVLSDTWFPSRPLWELLPALLETVEAGASNDRPWHLLLLSRVVPLAGAPETVWADAGGSAALNRTVTVVATGGASAADRAYVLSAAGANALLSRLTVHRSPIGTAMVSLPAVTALSGCDNARFLQGCPENGEPAPPPVADACVTVGASLPAAAFPSRAEADRVAEPMVLPVKGGEEKKERR